MASRRSLVAQFVMHSLSGYIVKAWQWFAGDAAHSSAVLALVTLWYVVMTRGMAKAMAQQTRAIVQPLASLEISTPDKHDRLKGSFSIRNRGSQPFMLLDARLTMHNESQRFVRDHTLYDKNLISPDDPFRTLFDFTDNLSKGREVWGYSPEFVWYDLQVVASDISGSVALTYRIWTSNRSSNCIAGIPREVRWRYFSQPVKWRYNRWKFRLERWRKKE